MTFLTFLNFIFTEYWNQTCKVTDYKCPLSHFDNTRHFNRTDVLRTELPYHMLHSLEWWWWL